MILSQTLGTDSQWSKRHGADHNYLAKKYVWGHCQTIQKKKLNHDITIQSTVFFKKHLACTVTYFVV